MGERTIMEHDGQSSLGVEESIVAAASYLGPLSIIILLLEKRSNFVRYHCVQSMLAFGLLLCLQAAVLWIPVLNRFFWWVPGGIAFVFACYMMVRAYYGDEARLPIIGQIAYTTIYHTGPEYEDVLAEPVDPKPNETAKG
jgi:uncharacterized membrane protein